MLFFQKGIWLDNIMTFTQTTQKQIWWQLGTNKVQACVIQINSA